MLISLLTAFATTVLGALAAYAFSRFRFKGRRMGMLALLLIQMFPQFVAVAAIYLIVLNIGDIFPQIGLDKLAAVVIVYLGGAMGVQAWLMKGFFDTIPTELDESARVDGATAAQIFWGVVLPLAAPVLAVVALISFVFTLNEFVIASTILQTTSHKTLPVGMQLFISDSYDKVWGPFAAGALLGAARGGAVHVPPALDRQRADRRLRQGMSLSELRGRLRCSTSRTTTAPTCYVLERPASSAAGRSCACAFPRPERRPRVLRYERDGEPRSVEAMLDEETAPTSGGARSSRSRTRSRATAGCSPAATPATPG